MNRLFLALSLTLGIAMAAPALAQSRVGSQAYSRSQSWIQYPGEIREVGRLINKGKVDEAVRLAEAFLDQPMPGEYRYDGLNALCVARTAARQLDLALEACDKAIDLLPSHWQAYNSRGTALYHLKRYEDAAASYRQALEIHPKSDIAKHNLSLTLARIAEVQPGA